MHKYYDSSFPTHGEDGRFVMLVMRQHYHAPWSLRKRAAWEQDKAEYLTQDGRPKLFEKDPKNPEYFHSVRGVGYKFTNS